jgi:hypothetical protein
MENIRFILLICHIADKLLAKDAFLDQEISDHSRDNRFLCTPFLCLVCGVVTAVRLQSLFSALPVIYELLLSFDRSLSAFFS